MEKKGCKHYSRGCEILAPCCNLFYTCHNCHDGEYKGVKGPGCLIERMDRTKIFTVRCFKCGKDQPSAQKCQFCEQVFGSYFCGVCNLFENNPNKSIYHCNECGICRIGKDGEYFHCDKCRICLSILMKDNHKCVEDGNNHDCPICLENLFYSRKASIPMKCCNRFMHQDCFRKYLTKFSTCPFCLKSIVEYPKEYIDSLEKFIAETKENLPEELKNKKVTIMCNDCLKKSQDVDYHPVGMKCGSCGSYNTKL